jgi:hypothetical protein
MGLGAQHSESWGKAKDLTPKEYKALRADYANLFSRSMPDISRLLQGSLGFEGPQGADLDLYRSPMTTGENVALENLNLMGQDPSEGEQLSTDLANKTLRGDFLRPEDNPALVNMISMVNRAINDSFNDQGLEQQSMFAKAGQRLDASSPFATAANELNSARMNAIADATGQLVFGVGESERDRQLQVMEHSRAQAQFEFQRQLETLSANALPRLIDEMGFTRAFDEYSARINALSQALGIGAGLTPATPVIETKSSSAGGSVGSSG